MNSLTLAVSQAYTLKENLYLFSEFEDKNFSLYFLGSQFKEFLWRFAKNVSLSLIETQKW